MPEQAKATELRLKTVEEKFQERVQQLDLQVSAQKDAIADANEDARLKAVSIGELEKKLNFFSDAHNLVHAKVCIMTQELTGMCCDSYLHLLSLLFLPARERRYRRYLRRGISEERWDFIVIDI